MLVLHPAITLLHAVLLLLYPAVLLQHACASSLSNALCSVIACLFSIMKTVVVSDAAADRGRYGKARNQILHVINAALAKVNLKYSLPPYPSQPMDRRMMQLLANMPTEALPDVQPLSY